MSTKIDLEQEGVEVKKACCYFCHQNCGCLVYVKDDKILHFEGDTDYPTNTGGLCCRGNVNLIHLDHEARVNFPLKRKGERGSGEWERITWEQAIDEIGTKLEEIRQHYGAEAVATAGGTSRTDDWARRRFMNLLGSPNGFHNSHLCWIPTFMIETAVYGWSPFEIDLGSSRCIVLWGQNPGASTLPEMSGVSGLKANGLKVIVIDPRFTETAAKADLWIPVRPGSDLALALAWINVIIYEGLADYDFVYEHCVGFDELTAHVEEFTPEWAEPLTGVSADIIREGARMYAMNKPGNIQWGTALDQIGKPAGATQHARAILRAITGNLDCPGADLLTGPSLEFVTDEEMELNEFLTEEQRAKQLGSDKFKLVTWPGYGRIAEIAKKYWGKAPTAEWMCEAHPPTVFNAILTGEPYPVKALLVSATNPVNSYGESQKVLAALKAVDFMVTCDYWLTPTAMLSDYVLPMAGSFERPTITSTYGCSDFLMCSQRAIQPMYERHSDFEFWRDLGIRLGQKEHWPWETLEDAYFYRIKDLGYGVESYDEFVEYYRFHFPEREYFKYKEKGGFGTPSGKVEIYSSVLEELGYPPLPPYIPPVENAVDHPELAKEYPLILTTGAGVMPFHHSEHFNIKELRFIRHEPHMEINPDTAAEYGIQEGDWVWVETRRGRIKQKASLTEGIRPGTVFTERGWWYPERDLRNPELGGCLESNTNVLTSTADEDCDPMSGSWANRGLLCKVYKVKSSDRREGK
ncbi:MAG TPA: molybdopterin-dependent oxidoreductase [Desulfitobacterium dehalogenans]|uniref:Molybdopterin-dependent oxidoreductase n=1 Tax=Desulfitobacterium dehalogenans TaxID=36854 RepID=A0A7C6Z2V9_9FIRM|nr:molybdopterin-dependent oxidoreductase [Desulfitobacterium dehalogenans]